MVKQTKAIREEEIKRLLKHIYGVEKPSIYQISKKEKLFLVGLFEGLETFTIPEGRECVYCVHYESMAGMYEGHPKCKKHSADFRHAEECKQFEERSMEV